jgi:hypothetical protein
LIALVAGFLRAVLYHEDSMHSALGATNVARDVERCGRGPHGRHGLDESATQVARAIPRNARLWAATGLARAASHQPPKR